MADVPDAAGGVAADRQAARATPTVALVVLAVAVGVVLRFVTGSPLWLDEALSVNIARLPLGDIGAALRQDGHPPLYYVLLHAWIRAFGEGDLAVRALSGVAAVAALPLAWLSGARLGGRQAAVAAVVLLSLSPFALRYGTEARMYAFVVLLVLVGHLTVRAVLDDPSALAPLVGTAAVTGILLLTHYWAVYLLAATVVVLALDAWHRNEWRPALRLGAAMAAGALAFVPWLPSFLSQAARTGTPWAEPTRPTAVFAMTLDDFGGPSFEGRLLGTLLLVLCLVALFARPVDGRRLELDLRTVPGVRGELAVAGLTLAFGVAAGYAANSTFASRYAAVVFPLVVVSAGVGVSRFADRRVAAGLLAGALVLGGVGAYRNVTTDRTQAGVVVAALDAQAQPGDTVVYCPDQLGPACSRHLRSGLTLVVYPTLAPPDRVDWRDYEARNAAADPSAVAAQILERTPPDRAIWLVWSAGYRTFGTQCEELAAQLQAARSPGVPVVVDDGRSYFEHAWLLRFDP